MRRGRKKWERKERGKAAKITLHLFIVGRRNQTAGERMNETISVCGGNQAAGEWNG
jgi:hypothetical protein